MITPIMVGLAGKRWIEDLESRPPIAFISKIWPSPDHYRGRSNSAIGIPGGIRCRRRSRQSLALADRAAVPGPHIEIEIGLGVLHDSRALPMKEGVEARMNS